MARPTHVKGDAEAGESVAPRRKGNCEAEPTGDEATEAEALDAGVCTAGKRL